MLHNVYILDTQLKPVQPLLESCLRFLEINLSPAFDIPFSTFGFRGGTGIGTTVGVQVRN